MKRRAGCQITFERVGVIDLSATFSIDCGRVPAPRIRHLGVAFTKLEQLWRFRGEPHFMKSSVCFAALAALGSITLAGCAPTGGPVATAPAAYNDVTNSARGAAHNGLDAKIARYARMYDIPESLIHRSIRRESNYNPGARNGPYWGLMQIRQDTARSMGYHGPASGLLDADTNLSYAVPYLANAYRVGGGSETRAIQLYASGYYYEAKRKHMLDQLVTAAKQ
jgi:soluble lytic murein transglycosylase-like protein